MEKDEFRISFSQVSTYKQCPHKWYLQYLCKLPSDESDELLFGSSIHSVIEDLLTNPLFKRLYKINPDNVIKDLFKSALKKKLTEIKDVEFLKTFKKKELGNIFMFQSVKLIKELNLFERFKDWEVEDVEYKLNGLTIAENEKCKIVFKGFIDLVLKSKVEEETYMILDWKTSGKKWDIVKKLEDNKDFYAQLCLYKNYYSLTKSIPFENIETKFYNLPRAEPKEQKIYAGYLTRDYVNEFLDGFIATCFQMYEHKQNPINFPKIKMLSKQNFCYRCKYNIEDLCNNTEEYQIPKL